MATSSKARFTGSLTALSDSDDDMSSSSGGGESSSNDDDDEAEDVVETFGHSTAVPEKAPTAAPRNALAEAMGAGIDKVLRDEDSPITSKVPDPTPAIQPVEDIDDEFGITFTASRSALQQQQQQDGPGYTLPSGPAFADEREFERELEGSETAGAVVHSVGRRAPTAQDEDEFAFAQEGDGSCGDGGGGTSAAAAPPLPPTAGASGTQAHTKAARAAAAMAKLEATARTAARREAAAQSARNAALASEELRSRKREELANAAAGASGASGVSAGDGTEELSGRGDSVRAGARAAMESLHSVYAAGLGDHEHELMEELEDGTLVLRAEADGSSAGEEGKAKGGSGNASVGNVKASIKGSVIEEEDEDEDEDETAAEARRATDMPTAVTPSEVEGGELAAIEGEWAAANTLRQQEAMQRAAAGPRAGQLMTRAQRQYAASGGGASSGSSGEGVEAAVVAAGSTKLLRFSEALAFFRSDAACLAARQLALYTVVYTDSGSTAGTEPPQMERMVLPGRVRCNGVLGDGSGAGGSKASLATMGEDLMPVRSAVGRPWTCAAAERRCPVEVAAVDVARGTLRWPGRAAYVLEVSRIVPSDEAAAGGAACCMGGGRLVGGPASLNGPTLRGERDLIFGIAECAFDGTKPVHVRLMQALHRGLTRTTHAVPMVGRHWGDIGFQVGYCGCCASFPPSLFPLVLLPPPALLTRRLRLCFLCLRCYDHGRRSLDEPARRRLRDRSARRWHAGAAAGVGAA